MAKEKRERSLRMEIQRKSTRGDCSGVDRHKPPQFEVHEIVSRKTRVLGGRNADDVGELTGEEDITELGDDEDDGRVGAETEDHAGLNVLDALLVTSS
ncbi:uncharacterized protein DS421_1g11540 [Arachis hypogaea]|nr:uncharacterized protein DS421_1g11540 [Arachis hypogaea]